MPDPGESFTNRQPTRWNRASRGLPPVADPLTFEPPDGAGRRRARATIDAGLLGVRAGLERVDAKANPLLAFAGALLFTNQVTSTYAPTGAGSKTSYRSGSLDPYTFPATTGEAAAVGQLYKIAGADVTPTFAHAVETLLAAHTLAGAWSAGTATNYRQTLTALAGRLAATPAGADVGTLDTPTCAAHLAGVCTAAFGDLAPATRLRHLSTLRSALTWWRTHARWIATDPTTNCARPKVPVDTTRALTRPQVAALFRLDVSMRDKTLWRLLYETAARGEEILTLNIEDPDLANKRARVTSKGGAIEWVFWQTGAALLLPRLLDGRPRGPVFLADRRPVRAVATNDLCPLTGRARLSYHRAAEIFEQATRPLANPVHRARGWTLHQLRHSILTHEAENGTATPILLARSRHASVRSLARYARPGPDAVAAHDPAARRRIGHAR